MNYDWPARVWTRRTSCFILSTSRSVFNVFEIFFQCSNVRTLFDDDSCQVIQD